MRISNKHFTPYTARHIEVTQLAENVSAKVNMEIPVHTCI